MKHVAAADFHGSGIQTLVCACSVQDKCFLKPTETLCSLYMCILLLTTIPGNMIYRTTSLC